jgi:UDP-N-acetylglucosamine 2-epimerase
MNFKKIKLVTVVGTRPEIIRLSVIIKKFDDYFDHTLIHTGQNYDYELNEIFFKDLDIRMPDYYLNSLNTSPISTIANCLIEIDPILEKVNPDVFFVLGDTNSSLTTIAAKRRKIPIFHYEAGNRCFDLNVPEEINRKIVDHISDVNITYSTNAKQNLINEGLPVSNIFNIGSPLKEVINFYSKKIKKSDILKNYDLQKDEYFLISAHREENVDNDKRLNELVNIIELIKEHFNKKIIFSIHPRTQKKLKQLNLVFNNNVICVKPLSFSDFACLQLNAFCTLSDSGSLSEETYLLKSKSINIRANQERHEALESGVLPLTDIDLNNILNSIDFVIKRDLSIRVDDYEVDDCSQRIVNLILSYYHYINKYTWHKNNL